MRNNSKRKSSLLRNIITIVFVLAVILAAVIMYFSYALGPVDSDGTEVALTIKEGWGINEIASALKENNLIKNEFIFKVYTTLTGKRGELKAGDYKFNTNMGGAKISDMLVEGVKRTTINITVKEGLDLNKISEYLESAGLFTQDEFYAEIRENFDFYKENYKFLKDVPAERDLKLEGYLFGDTYEVYSDSSPREVITKMLDRFGEIFKEEYYTRADAMGYTVDEIVTMASIVEREGILDSDLKKIASVFYNRLKPGSGEPYLASCATVQYIYKEYRFTFSTQELRIDNPYNTYKYKGLPPGPIANFRTTALEAALYPAKTDYLFFCSKNDGTGGTAFAKTYSQHQANIRKYLQ